MSENGRQLQPAIEEIFRRYNRKIYRLAISITRNEKDAQDVLQNTFIKIIKNLRYFRNQSNISTWVYRIAYNEALMFLRRKSSQFRAYSRISRNQKKALPGALINRIELPDKALLKKELKQRMEGSIRRLPIKYRMPLLLHNLHGLPIKEAAQVMRIKTNSFKTRLSRSRRLLGREISAYFQDKDAKEKKEDRRCAVWKDFFYKQAREPAFERHIRNCPACKNFIHTYKRAIFITRGLECQDIPLELKEKIQSFKNIATFLPLVHQKSA